MIPPFTPGAGAGGNEDSQSRGLVGFRCNSVDSLAYCDDDSQPAGLGVRILEEVRAVTNWDQAKKRICALRTYPESRCFGECSYLRQLIRRRFPKSMRIEQGTSLYDIMVPFQGSIQPHLDGTLPFLPEANRFLRDSRFCKWAYILSIDEKCLEVWKGDQTHDSVDRTKRQEEREPNPTGYFPCRRVATFDLNRLPNQSQFLEKLKG